MVSDPISDFLTRIRNGLMARKKDIKVNSSKTSRRIAEILLESGYISGFNVEKLGVGEMMNLNLRYDSSGSSVIDGLKRISKPGLRAYSSAADIPAVRGGLGITIVSTSKGVMTGAEAKKNNVGGEILCMVW